MFGIALFGITHIHIFCQQSHQSTGCDYLGAFFHI